MKGLIKSITYGLATMLMTISCTDSLSEDNGNDTIGGRVQFSSAVENRTAVTRGIEIPMATDYEPLAQGYVLNIQMSHMEGTPGTDTKDGDALEYKVGTFGTPIAVGADGTPTADGYPSIMAENTTAKSLYWPGNAVAYGFTATAGASTVPADQSNDAKLIAADRLLGYAGTNAEHDNISYRTAKDWKKDNESTTIPLFMKHQCAMISVILKPGEGVKETALNVKNVGTALKDTIFSYGHPADGDQPAVEDVKVALPHYETYTLEEGEGEDKTSWNTTKFTAIVEPFDYSSDANKDKPVTRIVINNQKYTFCASNDENFVANSDSYNLTAGKHLQLVITVGREGRLIHVYATEKDWEMVADNDIITDDFGHGNDPVIIHRGEGNVTNENSLVDFIHNKLEAGENVKGTIAILNNNIKLTSASETGEDKFVDETLNCTLNLNGYTLTTNRRLFKEISSTGMIKNGIVRIEGATGEIESVVAIDNNGTIDQIDVNGDVTATKGGIVVNNNKDIRNCINYIKVQGDNEFIGGIAAVQGSTGSIVNSMVVEKVSTTSTANTTTTLGGIVGKAGGTVTGCTYEYGITRDQTGGKVLHNIIGVTDGTIVAKNNSWPTIDLDECAGMNIFVNPYEDVIDCEAELKGICENGTATDRYRIADNFELSGSWTPTDMRSTLEGNDKTITTNGTMVFNSVTKEVRNLNVMLNKSIDGDASQSSGGRGGLAMSLIGGTLDNVIVRGAEGVHIMAPNPGGLVSGAQNDCVIKNCRNYVDIIANTTQNATIYAGGIVAEADNVTISGCQVASSVTIKGNKDLSSSVNLYSGGIFGTSNKDGVAGKGSNITDCASFTTKISANGDGKAGGIIGYIKGNSLTGTCIGNFWNLNNGVGEATADAASIGTKNAIIPTEL